MVEGVDWDLHTQLLLSAAFQGGEGAVQTLMSSGRPCWGRWAFKESLAERVF